MVNADTATHIDAGIVRFGGIEEFARSKDPSPDLYPPSPNLRYSVQILAYNEMPVADHEFREYPNLALNMRSLATAAHVFAKEGGDVSGIEILCNVNNRPNEPHPGNDRALQLLRSFSDSKPAKDLVAEFRWVPTPEQIAVLTGTERARMTALRKFYITLVSDMQSLVGRGLQVHAVDCTDGGAEPSPIGYVSYQATQGARRWLLSDIASHRFDIANGKSGNEGREDSQFMIPLDADSMVSPRLFVELDRRTDKLNGPSVCVLPYEFVRDTGWYVKRLEAYKDESGQPVIDTFQDKNLRELQIRAGDISKTDMPAASEFLRMAGFSEDQIRMFESVEPRDFMALGFLKSAYADSHARIFDFLNLLEAYINRHKGTDYQRDLFISNDIEIALAGILDVRTQEEPRDPRYAIPHTYGITGSFAFSVSAYKKSEGWDIGTTVKETPNLLSSFHTSLVPFYQIDTPVTKVKDRHRWESTLGSPDRQMTGEHGIHKKYLNMRSLRGLPELPYHTLDSWLETFVRNLAAAASDADLSTDEMNIMNEVTPDQLRRMTRNQRLQTTLRLFHIADIARDQYPGIYVVVRSLFDAPDNPE